MHDVIHLLPDNVANQIAAGEVIQRPASVIKELVENAIDAEATTIQIFLKDAGRTLIQVIDDGKGMSETDARMAFERHATSKIKSASDLFALRTMGFRGEALASIAAVAQVELHTRQEADELGTKITIEGSQVTGQESIHCSKGSNFMVKNLFYNIPARRKFLKSNETELRQIITEFLRIALVYPDIHFTMQHQDAVLYNLAPCNHRQRIKQLFPSRNNSSQHSLLPIDTHTSMGSIMGYIGTPDSALRNANQFFFVNGRYMRHPYFHKAVMQAYEGLIPKEVFPNYFIYFEMDPASIDVNIHPTKTEIKFEQETAIWSILMASVKEALSKSHAVPSLEFDQEGAIQIPPIYEATPSEQPKINVNPSYNPFNVHAEQHSDYQRAPFNWESLYQEFSQNKTTSHATIPFENPSASSMDSLELKEDDYEGKNTLWFKNRFIVVAVKSGLMFVDRRQAHVRILYEQWLRQLHDHTGISQKLLFPEIIHFNMADFLLIESFMAELNEVGFEMEKIGNHAIAINGVPSGLENKPIAATIEMLVEAVKPTKGSMREKLNESIALTLAKAAAVENDRTMTQEEMNRLLGQLFTCENPNVTPEGKKIIVLLNNEEIEKKFQS